MAQLLIRGGRQRNGDGSTCAYESGMMTCDRSTTARNATAAWYCAPHRLTPVQGGNSMATHERGHDGEGSMCAHEFDTATYDCSATTRKTTAA